MRFKSKSKVVSLKSHSDKDELILKNGAYLGEALYELPFGIINKTETGIGATTLELTSDRNSIIVEPLRVIAYTKVIKDPNRLYVGSAINSLPTTTPTQIKEYIADPSIKYKKIIVIADSLPKVMKAIGPEAYEDYFLMIDEGDSFQMDSTFRDSMEKCLDYYKEFPKDKRAIVSATPLDFSDPDLKAEHQTIIRYEEPTTRKISVVHTDNAPGTAYERIKHLVETYPADKIAVAYNSVQGCVELADMLVKNSVVNKHEVGILCSPNNKEKAGAYFNNLKKEALPARLNFLTSAYFTGLDIEEQFHLVSISNPKEIYSILSDHRLKQIAGRCRHDDGLLSETVVYGTTDSKTEEPEIHAVVELISAAEDEIRSLDCIKLAFKDNLILERESKKIRNLIMESTGYNGYRLVRESILTNEAKVSYFNIDAALENQRVRTEIYSNPENLYQLLIEDSHMVSFEKDSSTLKVGKSVKAKEKAKVEELNKVLKELERVTSKSDITELASSFTHGLGKNVIEEFQKYYGYIETAELISILHKAFLKDPKALKKLEGVFDFSMLSVKSPFKKSIFRNFPVGSKLTSEEIFSKLKDSARESSFDLPFIKSGKAAVEYLNSILTFSARGRKRGKEKTESTYTVEAHQPVSVKFIRKIPGVDGFDSKDYIE